MTSPMPVRPQISRKNGRLRLGRGFSHDELKKVGISLGEALRLQVPIDPRRRSVHDENVRALETFLASRKETSKVKRKSKKTTR